MVGAVELLALAFALAGVGKITGDGDPASSTPRADDGYSATDETTPSPSPSATRATPAHGATSTSRPDGTAPQAKAPAVSEEEVEPYDVPEIERLLEVAAQNRNSARWAVALALGLRDAHRARRRTLTPTTGKWKDLLKATGLREARLPDARHTVATVLLILGQPERTVMSLMGWSTTNMAARYQHVTDQIRADVASQVDSLIWTARAEGAPETVTVRRKSLATILPLIENYLLEHGDASGKELDIAELKAALADLRSALSEPDDDTSGGTK